MVPDNDQRKRKMPKKKRFSQGDNVKDVFNMSELNPAFRSFQNVLVLLLILMISMKIFVQSANHLIPLEKLLGNPVIVSIYKNKITDIDPKYETMKIFADLCISIFIGIGINTGNDRRHSSYQIAYGKWTL